MLFRSPTRSQNIMVIGRRSAVGGDDAGAGLGGSAGVSPVPRAAIALSRRLRRPSGTPVFSRSASTRSRRTPALISCGTRLRIVRGRSRSPLGDAHRRSRTRFDSNDGPRETASPGRERWPPAMGRLDPFARCQGMAAICANATPVSVRSRRTAEITEHTSWRRNRHRG